MIQFDIEKHHTVQYVNCTKIYWHIYKKIKVSIKRWNHHHQDHILENKSIVLLHIEGNSKSVDHLQ